MYLTSETALLYREKYPYDLFEDLGHDVAIQIIKEWRKCRESGPAQNDKTKEQLYERAMMIIRKFAKKRYVLENELEPVHLVSDLISHGVHISRASFKNYRNAVLHFLNELAVECEEKNRPYKSLATPLAVLIINSQCPFDTDSSAESTIRPVRSIQLKYFQQLMDVLLKEQNRGLELANQTRLFAIATLVTGIRPVEWEKVVVLSDTEPKHDGSFLDLSNSRIALRVDTAKRKAGEPQWIRTLIVEHGGYQRIILEHIATTQKWCKKSTMLFPYDHYRTIASKHLKNVAQNLWPDHPDRWITLYSLRRQARANAAAQFGAVLGAAIMGHSVKVSQSNYTGIKHAQRGGLKLAPGMRPIVLPGPDCHDRAQAMQVSPDPPVDTENVNTPLARLNY